MPEFDITYSFEKTFTVIANSPSEAEEKGAEILAEYMELNESAMKQEIHYVEA